MSFIESALLDRVAYGFSASVIFDKTVVRLRNGMTRRNLNTSRPLHRFVAPFDKIDTDDQDIVIATFNAVGVSAFRFRDWSDYQIINQQIAVGTGAAQNIQLFKLATFGTATFNRIIRKPSAQAVLTADGSPLASTTDVTTGIVTFTATASAVIRATVDFDVPVFFESSDMEFTLENWRAHTGEVSLLEDLQA